MARLFRIFLLIFLITGAGNELSARFQLPAGTPEQRGEWLARQIDDRETGDDARFEMRMRLFDRQDRARERVLTLLAKRAQPGSDADGDRTLIRFSYPNDIDGTGFLVWQHPGEDDERFLYLPALGRVRRIAGSEAQESFVGSDFTYEDIGGREFENYSYRLLSEQETWADPAGASHDVWRLESRHKDADARYPRVVSLVRKDNFVVVHAEIHNRRDEVQKTYDVRRLERVSGYWTALDMVMRDAQQRTRTELVIETAEYDVGLSDSDFTRRALERREP
jgi:hypothetical protein